MEVLLQIIRCEKMDGWKINKRGGSNKGMADGFFLKNKYPWYHGNSLAQSMNLDTNLFRKYAWERLFLAQLSETLDKV